MLDVNPVSDVKNSSFEINDKVILITWIPSKYAHLQEECTQGDLSRGIIPVDTKQVSRLN